MIDVTTLQTVVFGTPSGRAVTGTVIVVSFGVFIAIGVRIARKALLADRSKAQDEFPIGDAERERERRRCNQMSRDAADRAQRAGPATRSDDAGDDGALVEWTSETWAISVRETQPERFLLEVVDIP